MTYTADGQPEATSLLSYLVPSPADLPSFDLDRTVTPTTINPLGAKGVAEAVTIAAPAAIMNAVNMPGSTYRVWSAIRAATERG